MPVSDRIRAERPRRPAPGAAQPRRGLTRRTREAGACQMEETAMDRTSPDRTSPTEPAMAASDITTSSRPDAAGAPERELTDGFHLVIDALKLNGIDTIYGVPGIPITDL